MVFSEMGDGMAAAFASPTDGIDAAVTAQLGLGASEWGETGPLRVRMGLHAGTGALLAARSVREPARSTGAPG